MTVKEFCGFEKGRCCVNEIGWEKVPGRLKFLGGCCGDQLFKCGKLLI